MERSEICRYCGGVIRLVPARAVYGSAVKRLGLEKEYIYQCQNCNARVGCHKGTTRPLGHVANETLRLKRMETHQVFDAFWKRRGMSRTKGYQWLARQMGLPTSADSRWNNARRSSTFAEKKRRAQRNVRKKQMPSPDGGPLLLPAGQKQGG